MSLFKIPKRVVKYQECFKSTQQKDVKFRPGRLFKSIFFCRVGGNDDIV
jgi:hypothetical protein